MEVESALDGIRTPWDATFNVALVSIRETSSSKVPSNSPSVSQGMNLKYPSAVAATLNTIFRLMYSQKVSKISFTINITSTSPSGKPVWCITSRCIIFYFWLILSIMGDTLIYSKNGHRLTKFESYTYFDSKIKVRKGVLWAFASQPTLQPTKPDLPDPCLSFCGSIFSIPFVLNDLFAVG